MPERSRPRQRLWLASGDKSLERLKKAIQEVNEAGPKPRLALDLFLKFGPFVEFRNNRARIEPVADRLTARGDHSPRQTFDHVVILRVHRDG